jgi:hypothetical protein
MEQATSDEPDRTVRDRHRPTPRPEKGGGGSFPESNRQRCNSSSLSSVLDGDEGQLGRGATTVSSSASFACVPTRRDRSIDRPPTGAAADRAAGLSWWPVAARLWMETRGGFSWIAARALRYPAPQRSFSWIAARALRCLASMGGRHGQHWRGLLLLIYIYTYIS